jgi:hypothetical protein
MAKSAVAKSSILVQKERELKDLQKQKEKTSKAIATTKSKIATLQGDIEQTSKDMMSGLAQAANLQTAVKEVLAVYKDLRKKVKLSRNDKAEIEAILEQSGAEEIVEEADGFFEQTPFGSAENFHKGEFSNFDENKFNDEFNRKRQAAMFDPFVVKPTEQEQQQIRKIYIELANRFHPDKAKTEAQQKLAHELMQRINAAYQRGDMAELLEIQKNYPNFATAETTDLTTPLLDILDEQILRAQHDLALLDSQLNRLKTELNELKTSDLGQMSKQNKRQSNQFGSSEEASTQTNYIIQMFKTVKETLEEWLTAGKKPKSFKSIVDGSHPIFERGRELGIIMNNDDDDDDEMTLEEYEEMMSFFNTMFEQQQQHQQRQSGKKRRK